MSRADSRRVPSEVIDKVVQALYADAERLDWTHLPPQQRTAQYDQWVADSDIGGVLTEHMSSETARSWIKDGPMKEYARAVQGAGRYGRFGSSSGPTPDQITLHAVGETAVVVQGSAGVKPFHCVAADHGRQIFIAWGEAKNFRYLVWACLSYLVDEPGGTATIVVTETMAQPTMAVDKARFDAIASRCSLGLKYYRLAATGRGPLRAGR